MYFPDFLFFQKNQPRLSNKITKNKGNFLQETLFPNEGSECHRLTNVQPEKIFEYG